MADEVLLRCPRCGGQEFSQLRAVVTVLRWSLDPETGRMVRVIRSQDLEDQDTEPRITICENGRCNYESRNYDEWIVQSAVYG